MFDPELRGDDHRRARRRQADEIGATGHERQSRGRSPRHHLHHALRPVQSVQPPDRERRAAIGLVDDRALVDRVQRVVAEAPGWRRARRLRGSQTRTRRAREHVGTWRPRERATATRQTRHLERVAAARRAPPVRAWPVAARAPAARTSSGPPAPPARRGPRGRALSGSSLRAPPRAPAPRPACRWSCSRARTA